MNNTIYLINNDINERLACSKVITEIDATISIKTANCTDEFIQVIGNGEKHYASVAILAITAVTDITHLKSFLTIALQFNLVPIIISPYEGSGLEGEVLNCGAMRFYRKPFSEAVLHSFLQDVIADHLS